MSETVLIVGTAQLPETYTDEELIDAVSPHAEYVEEPNEGVFFNLNEGEDSLDKVATFYDSGSVFIRGFSDEHFEDFVEELKELLSESGLLTEDQVADIEFEIDNRVTSGDLGI